MEKIKITVEQEEALSEYIGCSSTTENLGIFIKSKEGRGYTEDNMFHSLQNFTPEQFAQLLCGWYEVEQPIQFNVGEWIYDKKLGDYTKITKIDVEKNEVLVVNPLGEEDHDGLSFLTEEHYEKVTEPWKIMLLELGREKPEFDDNDIIVTDLSGFQWKWRDNDEVEKLFETGVVTAFHPAEHRIEVPKNV